MGPQFDPIASWHEPAVVRVGDASDALTGVPVASAGAVPERLGVDRDALAALGFDGERGQHLPLRDRDGKPVIAYGIGDPESLDAAAIRQAAGDFAKVAEARGLAFGFPEGADTDAAVTAAVEGVLLARYRPGLLQTTPSGTPLDELTILTGHARAAAAQRGAILARATALSRDLANSPPSMLTAERLAEVAEGLAAECGWSVETFDKAALAELGCGGLLGVNAGSVDEPRMIKIRYEGPADAPKLALVGKGIMYDSGGIALKPADAVHATMKNDMSGAGSILAAMAVLKSLDCPTTVTAYLMCTDNMPSGSATKLGDVLVMRGGKTVEVINTDAEGRLVMADALVLAGEEAVDAIVDMATLTGACLRALGAQIAGVFGNHQGLVDQVLACAESSGEPAWQLPLARRYRHELDSDVADIKNMGGPNAAAIHAALFLDEFTGGRPWAHVDIAGTAQTDTAGSWRTPGCTGFGARMLAELACGFRQPKD
ncbi:leucyl aminopeptidase [Phytomonospora sp. NPDC050363]|uniref:leucyl aminopeptidase family protein n=1 Tax=Phytomonospora sp. NPDC050363 TaxID=3155642 RepID=UPI0033CF5690